MLHDDFTDSISVIEAAAALGMDISAPAGTRAWLVRIPERERRGTRATKPLGLFPTQELALEALAAHAVSSWRGAFAYQPGAPWYVYPKRDPISGGYSEGKPTTQEKLEDWLICHNALDICEMYIYLQTRSEDSDLPNDLPYYVMPLRVQHLTGSN